VIVTDTSDSHQLSFQQLSSHQLSSHRLRSHPHIDVEAPGRSTISLGTWPTPLEPAQRLGVRLGLGAGDLWLKRDDLVGLGGGGNKIRKLQHTAGAALGTGADTLVTTGAAQSNHARATAAVAARLGLRCLLVLAGDPPGPAPGAPTGNLSLDRLFGADVHWAGRVANADLDDLARERVAAMEHGGRRPFLIPYGGSGPVGARGYVDCARELTAQAPDSEHVVVAVGSGGTMAGLVAGLGAGRVLGVDTGATPDPERRVAAMVEALGGSPQRLRLDHGQVGAGYSQLSEAGRRALSVAAETEGVVLDPVYTARALAGLHAAVAAGDVRPGQRTVFVHTGGLPGLFGHPVAAELAAADDR